MFFHECKRIKGKYMEKEEKLFAPSNKFQIFFIQKTNLRTETRRMHCNEHTTLQKCALDFKTPTGYRISLTE